jgi:hypothetical protein
MWQLFGSVCVFTHVPLQLTVPASQLSVGPSCIEPSLATPVSCAVPSPEEESPGVPVSIVIDESTLGPPSPIPSTLESPPPPHVSLSEHVPNVSVPHPAPHTASPASPTQIPNVTA